MSRRRQWILRTSIACAVVFLSLFVWDRIADPERLMLDDALRAEVGGTFVKLRDGVTHYTLTGDSTGPVVVLLHGAGVASWDFDLQVGALQSAGFSVLRYDGFGRGLSDRPEGPLTRARLRNQLHELLDHLGISAPVALVGHSLGGATAVDFAAHFSQKAAAVVLVAPVVNRVVSKAPYILCNTPLLHSFLARNAVVPRVHRRANSQWSSADVDRARYDRLFEQQQSIKGFARSTCAMFQSDLVTDYRQEYAAVGAAGIPTLLAWGAQDDTVSAGAIRDARARLKTSRFLLFPHTGHSPHIEEVIRFNSEMIRFLTSEMTAAQ